MEILGDLGKTRGGLVGLYLGSDPDPLFFWKGSRQGAWESCSPELLPVTAGSGDRLTAWVGIPADRIDPSRWKRGRAVEVASEWMGSPYGWDGWDDVVVEDRLLAHPQGRLLPLWDWVARGGRLWVHGASAAAILLPGKAARVSEEGKPVRWGLGEVRLGLPGGETEEDSTATRWRRAEERWVSRLAGLRERPGWGSQTRAVLFVFPITWCLLGGAAWMWGGKRRERLCVVMVLLVLAAGGGVLPGRGVVDERRVGLVVSRPGEPRVRGLRLTALGAPQVELDRWEVRRPSGFPVLPFDGEVEINLDGGTQRAFWLRVAGGSDWLWLAERESGRIGSRGPFALERGPAGMYLGNTTGQSLRDCAWMEKGRWHPLGDVPAGEVRELDGGAPSDSSPPWSGHRETAVSLLLDAVGEGGAFAGWSGSPGDEVLWVCLMDP
jgi:hypothetical protein